MDVYEAIRKRKSVKAYMNKPVEKEKLERVLEAARLAPSAGNRQEWRFVVVSDSTKRKMLAYEAAGQPFMAEAAIIIACCAETDGHIMQCGLPSYPIDVSIAIDHLTLAAVQEGLGTCWIGAFDVVKTRKLLGIPPEIEVVQLLTLGYPVDPLPVEKSRLSINDIVHYEKW